MEHVRLQRSQHHPQGEPLADHGRPGIPACLPGEYGDALHHPRLLLQRSRGARDAHAPTAAGLVCDQPAHVRCDASVRWLGHMENVKRVTHPSTLRAGSRLG